ncbi:YfhO family protein [Cytophagaceae bacterium ABcell3]|nr:YfhO family protein [Cytophagaceae bacterium ABcell3]
MNKYLKTFLPHLLAFAAFILLVIIYFSPVFFEGKELELHDAFHGIASGQEAREYRERTGEEALWTNSMFGGMPLYIINIIFSGDLLSTLRSIILFLPRPAEMVFVLFFGFYILLVTLRCRPLVAFAGAFAYAFSTFAFVSIDAGHIWKVVAMGYAPLLLAGIILTLRKQYLPGLLLTALAVYLQISSQHIQITYYFALLIGIFFISELIISYQKKTLPDFFKACGVLLIAASLGVGANFGRLWTVQEYSQYSIRGKAELSDRKENGDGGLDKDYAFRWSQGRLENLTFFVPNLYGGGSQMRLGEDSETYKALRSAGNPAAASRDFVKNAPMYWGDQPMTSGPVYIGIVIVFFFVLGMFILGNNLRWWLLGGTVLSILLSLGHNFESFNYFMFDYFPGYNKFRAVTMVLVIALFTLPLTAALSLEKLIFDVKENNKELLKNLMVASGITGGIVLLVLLFSGSPSYVGSVDERLPEWLRSAIRSDRASLLRSDAWRSLLLILFAAGLVFFYVKKKLSFNILMLCLAGLIVIDLWSVNKRFLYDDKFEKGAKERFLAPTAADKVILSKGEGDPYYRVLNLAGDPFNEARTSYHHKSVGGYHGAKMRRYQDLIEHHLGQMNRPVLNMLNTRFVITGQAESPVQENRGALGPVWLVDKVEEVQSPDEEIAFLGNFNPSETAVVDASLFTVNQQEFSKEGSIELTHYEPNHLKYQFEASQPSFAVFSDIYYPEGWQAYIDGNPVEHMRVNYVLRGLEIPAGTHEIEFKFDPASYRIGNIIMLISSILIILLIPFVLFVAFKKKSHKEELVEEAVS